MRHQGLQKAGQKMKINKWAAQHTCCTVHSTRVLLRNRHEGIKLRVSSRWVSPFLGVIKLMCSRCSHTQAGPGCLPSCGSCENRISSASSARTKHTVPGGCRVYQPNNPQGLFLSPYDNSLNQQHEGKLASDRQCAGSGSGSGHTNGRKGHPSTTRASTACMWHGEDAHFMLHGVAQRQGHRLVSAALRTWLLGAAMPAI